LDPFESPFRPTKAPGFRPPETPAEKDGQADAALPSAGVAMPQDFPIDLRQTIQDYEIALINNAMATNQFNQKKTADALGVTYHQLRGYLKKYNLLEKEA